MYEPNSLSMKTFKFCLVVAVVLADLCRYSFASSSYLEVGENDPLSCAALALLLLFFPSGLLSPSKPISNILGFLSIPL